MGQEGIGKNSGIESKIKLKMKKIVFIALVFSSVFISGCGYTTGSTLPGNLRTIYVEHFENKINYATESKRNVYFPLLEVDVRNAIIDRFLFDGNLRILEADTADMILKGELIGYEREPLRYTDDDDIQEYRIEIVVNLTLTDTKNDLVIWQENGFRGEAEYFVTGSQAITEATAVSNATVDLARRVVERTIENW